MISRIMICSAFLLAGLQFSQAMAAEVNQAVLQKGYFLEAEGKCDAVQGTGATPIEDSAFDYCGCRADIVYPQVSDNLGTPLYASRINTRLKMLTPNTLCRGKQATPASEKQPGTISSEFHVTLNTNQFLSVLMEINNYPAGAAHGMTRMDAASFMLPEGEAMKMTDLIDPVRLPEVNAYIYDYLMLNVYDGSLNENDYWGQILKDKKDHFVDEKGCNECVFYLGQKQPMIAFQLYSVTSYAGGIVEMPLPINLLRQSPLKNYYEGLSDVEG